MIKSCPAATSEMAALDVCPHGRKSDVGITRVDGPYSKYVLTVLVVVFALNYVDRQILAILAEDIKLDLGLSDGQLGFLYGTAFAVFYATFGIALGRLADVWNRKKLIAIGVGFWSIMTALSGFARAFLPLSICRFGVGVGEACATPAAYSIIYDYFSRENRTTALAVYSCGGYVGAGLGLILGGVILQGWNEAWPEAQLAPLGLAGWQAAFLIAGVPGLAVALWVSTLREPLRGFSDGIVSEPHPRPFREAAGVLLSMVPLVNLVALGKGGDGRRSILINIGAALAIFTLSTWLIYLTGDILQWTALGIAFYAVVAWVQGLIDRDPVTFGMIFQCKTLRNVILLGGMNSFMAVGFPFWAIPYLKRFYEPSDAELGTVLGGGSAFAGCFGLLLGGILADKLHSRTPRGKLYVWLSGITTAIAAALTFLASGSLVAAYIAILTMYFAGAIGVGPYVSMLNDLVLPRSRATTSAFAIMFTTFSGVALAPYAIGQLSDIISNTSGDSTSSLRMAMLASLFFPAVGLIFGWQALRHIETDEKELRTRARALGEDI